MGYVLEGVAYVGGTALIGAGLYLVISGNFPTWWRNHFAWPLVRITPLVSQLHGAAAIVIGASVLAIVFTTVAPETAAGLLALGALAGYVVGVGLYLLGAWVSRRPA